MPDHLRSFYRRGPHGGAIVHAGVWETIADTLFWLQLCWVFSGFLLMGYLAFKVLPDSLDTRNGDRESRSEVVGPASFANGNADQVGTSILADNYRLEAFSPLQVSPAKIIEFRSAASEENRRVL